MNQTVLEKVKTIIQPALDSNGVFLYDIEYVKEGNDWILRVLIDKEHASIDLDICCDVSEAISQILDKNDPIPNEYILEVSSPGVERPLKTLENYKDAIGKYVLIQLVEPQLEYNELVGTIISVNDTAIELEIRIKTRTQKLTIEFKNIAKAMTTVKL